MAAGLGAARLNSPVGWVRERGVVGGGAHGPTLHRAGEEAGRIESAWERADARRAAAAR